MKKILSIIATMLMCIAAGAQDYQMRAAIEKAMFNDKLLTINSFSNAGFDEGDNGEETRRWSVLQYEFSVKQPDAELLLPIEKAFEKDRADKRTSSFVKSEPTTQMYSFLYSSQLSPVTIGSLGQARVLYAIVGDEKPGVNTVIAMEVWKNSSGDIVSGKIYIIERDPAFKASPLAASDKPVKPEQAEQMDFFSVGLSMINDAINETPENLRRLYFYANKYETEAKRGNSGSAIVKATIFVVSDIIQTGSDKDKSMAKQIIDNMIMTTPDPVNARNSEIKAVLQENINTLINLLARLDSKNEYSATMTSAEKTFRIDGTIDEELWDIGYYISTSDETMENPVINAELVKAEGKTFHFQAELDDIRLGRVRALFKDGTVCSAWIEILFVPGETAELHVHNGYYTLDGTGFYRQWNEASSVFTAPWSVKPEHREKVVLDVLKQNTDKPAYFVFVFKEKHLRSKENLQKAYNLLPDDIKQSPYGVYLRRYL